MKIEKSVGLVLTILKNNYLRRQIVDMTVSGKDGHIPSAFSILDIVTFMYENVLRVNSENPLDEKRDIFILSKGHGCLAQYVNLRNKGFVTDDDIEMFCKFGGILGEHPDMTKINGVEASTGSLGHGLSFAVGIAIACKIQKRKNRVFVLIGDGESQEGTVWEAAHIAANYELNNLCVVVDFNQSGMQLLPKENLKEKWLAFGWDASQFNGHEEEGIQSFFLGLKKKTLQPTVGIANTIKGKGVSFMEGHGKWHHRIPDDREYAAIMDELR